MVTIVYAEIHTGDCYATLSLNGIPILSAGRRGVVFSSMPARQVLVEGSNRLELVVEPVVKPSLSRVEQRRLTLTDKWAIGRLVRYDEGVPALVENGTTLVENHWASDGLEATYPVVVSKSVQVPDAKHRWRWQDAPVLEPGPELFAEASKVLDTVADAIRRSDVDAFMAATQEKLRDARTAYPVRSEAGDRTELGQFLEFWKKAKSPVRPFDPEAHDFRLVAGGRMLETVDADGLASLRLVDPNDGEEIPYPLFLAAIDGRLQVVR